MNKKLNIVLNITEILLVLLIILSMFILSRISINGLSTNLYVLRKVLLYTSVLSEIIIIGTELLLFMVYKKNIKYLYIAYIIGELSLALLINLYVPFSGLIVIGLLSIIKGILRLNYITKIYNKRLFNKYCKLFNIKLSTVSTRKTTKKRKTTRKRVTTTTRKQVKSYA